VDAGAVAKVGTALVSAAPPVTASVVGIPANARSAERRCSVRVDADAGEPVGEWCRRIIASLSLPPRRCRSFVMNAP